MIYCGMSGREIDTKAKASPKRYGLITRLNSHASGRLSGDQFCVYVANRFVIPSLSAEELPMFETGELTLRRPDMPRDASFLLSRNRLNVAISRARPVYHSSGI